MMISCKFILIIMLSLFVVTPSLLAGEEIQPRSMWDQGYAGQATPGDFVLYVNSDGLPISKTELFRIDRSKRTLYVTITTYEPVLLGSKKVEQKSWVYIGQEIKEAHPMRVKDAEIRLQDGTKWRTQLREFLGVTSAERGQVIGRDWISARVPFNGIVQQERGKSVVQLSQYVYQKARRP